MKTLGNTKFAPRRPCLLISHMLCVNIYCMVKKIEKTCHNLSIGAREHRITSD